jgi:hypothetical protein
VVAGAEMGRFAVIVVHRDGGAEEAADLGHTDASDLTEAE